ncbi:MAG: PilC/PilY family type IV pilus protein [Pseudomonadota bacterium]
MFDDSLSMSAQFIYQFGGLTNGFGKTGPGVNAATSTMCPQDYAGITCTGNYTGAGAGLGNYPTAPSITVTATYNQPISSWYWEQSPDVNGLYYDPRNLYTPRVNSTGTYTTAGTTSTTAFYVYFYKNGSNANVTWPGTSPGTTAFPTPTLAASFFSTTTPYIPSSSLLAGGATVGLTYPTVVDSLSGPFPKFFNRTDCNAGIVGGSCSLAEERQNYANWKKYHSNRMDLAKTGIGFAFKDMTSAIRLGWATINNLDLSNTMDSGVGLYIQAQKDLFYNWLYALNVTGGGTPNRNALNNVGQYYARSDNLGPWAHVPVVTSKGLSTLATSTTDTVAIRAAQYSCRRSYSMLMTDGYYDSDTTNVGNVDATAISTISGTTATGGTITYSYNGTTKPYTDAESDRMADVAMKYWITDLRTDLKNNVKQIPATVINGATTTYANESFWQNMSFYAVGLGVYGNYQQNTTTLAQLTAGTLSWPTIPAAGNVLGTIDDMWHATINARGRILSAKNSSTLSDAVEGMLADINKNTASQSGVAASTASLKTGTRKYTPKYTTGSWTGNVVATALDPSSGAEISVTWQVVGTNAAGTYTYNGIPAYGSRNIYSRNSILSSTSFGSFDASNPYVLANVVGANTNLINYLRGDQTNEDPNGLALYRAREYLLGDIVNSTPVYIKGGLDSSYDQFPAGTYGQSTYAAFVATKAARTEGVLFAGANDGMLHGFRDTTGAEVFAFVPQTIMPKLHQLASRSYDHKYYVDGPLKEADACLTGLACTVWTNMLLGTTGAGGTSVFALDVTDPMNMSAAKVKWEVTPSTTGYASMGNIITEVQTGLTASGEWVAIFGNGYYGPGGFASLYIANLDTGALIKQISTGVGSSNGLGGVSLVLDGNQKIVGAYAGDLKGNMWKFDLSSTSSTGWKLGLSNSPLYNAGTTKPITARPAVVAHPNGGNVVVFATGKLFDSTDVTNTVTQTTYGIWDSVAFGSSTTPVGVTQTGTTTLVQQTTSIVAITGTLVITNPDLTTQSTTINYYAQSSFNVDWTTKRGWYRDMLFTGQRVIYPFNSLGGTYLLQDTMSPTNVSTDPCIQSGAAKAWNYVIDGVSGAAPTIPIFDTNGDGLVNSSDSVVSGYENYADGKSIVVKNEFKSTDDLTCQAILAAGQQLPQACLTCALTGTCKSPAISGIVKRSWRQLFLR